MPLATTDLEYYGNPEHFGEGQYVTLDNIIDNVMALAGDDDYLKNIKKFRAEIVGKLGIKKLEVDVKPDKKAISFSVPPSKIFPFPRYMVDWYQASVINKCDKLQTLIINNQPRITDYFQDNEAEIFFDCDGSVLTSPEYDMDKGHCCYKFECKTENDCGCQEDDLSKSWIKAKRSDGYFSFSDDLIGRTIVLQFVSVGLDKMKACDIKVHHYLEATLMAYIQYNLLRGKKNVPKSDWLDYYKTYLIEKKRSKDLLGDKITLEEIAQYTSIRYSP